jgi:hypothetical protein
MAGSRPDEHADDRCRTNDTIAMKALVYTAELVATAARSGSSLHEGRPAAAKIVLRP